MKLSNLAMSLKSRFSIDENAEGKTDFDQSKQKTDREQYSVS